MMRVHVFHIGATVFAEIILYRSSWDELSLIMLDGILQSLYLFLTSCKDSVAHII